MAMGASLAWAVFVALVPVLKSGTISVYSPANLRHIRNQLRVKELQPRADLHRERLRASWSEASPPSWSGSYRHSDGFEHLDLDLGADGFYYEAHNCTGTTELGWGKVAGVEGTLVRLEIQEHVIVERPSPDEDRRQRFRFSTELYVVPWGKEHFLVPAELMEEFCSLAKAGRWDSMTYADYPRRVEPGESVWDRPHFDGLPDVPTEFRKYLPH
ncbi:MAG: hypothetical protein HOP15_06125 [Planctomycetes bacterium]|nr:hypothetical protein [Planctomycetota bacterium]